MKCENCGAERNESELTCQYCGADYEEQLSIQDEVEFIDEPDCDVDAEDVDIEQENAEDDAQVHLPVKKRKLWQSIIAIACCVTLLSTLVLLVLSTMGIYLNFKADDIYCKENYSVADEKADKTASKVVARIGDLKLTNAELQVYYTLQIYEYSQYYGSVLSYIGLDLTKPLAEQPCYFDDTMSWQQYFINVALETWQHYAVLNMLADEAGIELTESDLAELNAIPQEFEAMAKMYNFDSADAFIKKTYGVNTDMDAYLNYIRVCDLGKYYYGIKSIDIMPLTKDIEDYYKAHQSDFAMSGITKDSGPIVDVRHILIQPEGGELDEETNTTVYTDEAWAKALKEAEALLDQWKNGDADQDSFAELATANTDDTGSAANGGLYQNITRTSSYVEPFLNWAVDENRQTGDTGIVKTVFGYHIMYFVSGEPQWFMAARTQALSERIDEIIAAGTEKWPMKVKYKSIALCTNELVK